MRTVHLTHHYDAPAKEVWDIATDYDCLAEVMSNLIAFEGLPSGKVMTDQKFNVMVSLFGLLPAQPYHMEVLECDDHNMLLKSSERGAGVKCWKHTLRVTPTQTGSQLTDTIEIDAGWLTWGFALWAGFLYKKRHGPRVRILERNLTAS
jgi:ligand-binding SRPBCC domain-containing protein